VYARTVRSETIWQAYTGMSDAGSGGTAERAHLLDLQDVRDPLRVARAAERDAGRIKLTAGLARSYRARRSDVRRCCTA
jgi:hypothetical protein